MFNVKEWINDNYGPCLAAEYEWETGRATEWFRKYHPIKKDPTLGESFPWTDSVRGFSFWQTVCNHYWDDYYGEELPDECRN